jgi:hypothetical protein
VKERAGAAASSLGGSGDGDELGVVVGPEGRMAPEEKEEAERRPEAEAKPADRWTDSDMVRSRRSCT